MMHCISLFFVAFIGIGISTAYCVCLVLGLVLFFVEFIYMGSKMDGRKAGSRDKCLYSYVYY